MPYILPHIFFVIVIVVDKNKETSSILDERAVAEIQGILDSRKDLEIEILADGSIHAVPRGTRRDAEYPRMTLKEAMAEADRLLAQANGTQAQTQAQSTETDAALAGTGGF